MSKFGYEGPKIKRALAGEDKHPETARLEQIYAKHGAAIRQHRQFDRFGPVFQKINAPKRSLWSRCSSAIGGFMIISSLYFMVFVPAWGFLSPFRSQDAIQLKQVDPEEVLEAELKKSYLTTNKPPKLVCKHVLYYRTIHLRNSYLSKITDHRDVSR